MNDGKRLLYSGAAGVAVFAALMALYGLEGRRPNQTLIAATVAMSMVGAWYFLGRNRAS